MVGLVPKLWARGGVSQHPRPLHSPAPNQDLLLAIPVPQGPWGFPTLGGGMPQPFLGLTSGAPIPTAGKRGSGGSL